MGDKMMLGVFCVVLSVWALSAEAAVWRDQYGRTSLHNAAQLGQGDKVEALLAGDEELLELRDFRGHSPLFLMAWKQNVAMTQRLIDAGASLEARDHLGRTPLMVAAYHGNAAIVEVLLAADANADGRDERGNTALHGEAQTGIRFFEHEAVMRALIDAGVDVMAKNDAGQTPLAMARALGWSKRVVLLQAAARR